jgi:Protein of unknown function (DUF2905)
VAAGLFLVLFGLLLMAEERLPIRLGHLPGDILIRMQRGTFYFPVATCVLVSVVLSLLTWLIRRLDKHEERRNVQNREQR